ncbi:uncharacterized protein LOC134727840 [Mytilus trossulus]|uniref:uncharacterized protein LOC134727840 n=1 Tax=Mytilus trossulus TaxID=6551 RepID=UPI003003FDB6
MIVGKNGAGKSSLLRRLLKEDTKNVESTDGIDIVVRRCKINTETGEWIIDKNGVSDTKQERIQRVIDQTLENNSKDTVRVSKSPTPKSGPDEVQTRNEIETIISGIIDHSEPEPKPKPEPEPVTATENIKNRKTVLGRQLAEVFGKLNKFKHLQNIYYLSNRTDKDDEFEKLRKEISETATKMNTWGECVPLKWILLEHLIEVNMEKKKNYIEFSDMREMAAHSEIGIEDSKEVLRFLCFQHEVGNIIYFEDIPDLIILNPQWLVDAFRCLVSDKIDPTAGWTDFLQNGLLTKSLITKLFESKSGDNFVGKTKELLDIMLKFDILVKTNEKDKYVMPSMMPTKSFEEVYETIGGDHPNCTRTSWFCLQFEFLPPAFFNHFSAGYMKKYKPTKVNEGKSMALYRGICVFDVDIMDKSESEKLLLTMSANRIAVQLLSFSEKQKNIGNMCCTIRKELISKIKDIEKRYKLKVSYKEHFKCSTGNYYGDTRPYDYLKSVTVYHCDEHKGEHKSEELYLPWMPDEVDDEKKLNDQIQISNKQVKVTPEIDVENVSDDSYVEQQKIFREVIVKESPRKTLNVQNNL